MLEKIAIVTNDDFIIGYEDKIKVHELGILHPVKLDMSFIK
jgi:hypothetical protein